jgi:hypothetical protein
MSLNQFRLLLWALLIAPVIAVVVFKFHRSTPVRHEVASIVSVQSVGAIHAPSTQLEALAERPKAGNNFIAALIAKLRQWNVATDPVVQEQMESELEGLLTDANVAGILRQLPSEFLDTPFAVKALEKWSQFDPAEALRWLAQDSKPMNTYAAIAVLSWLDRDIGGLREYINNFPVGEWKQQVLSMAASGALQKNLPEDAVAWLAQLSPGNQDRNLLEWAARVWAQKDFAAAVKWVDEQADPELHDRLLANLAAGLAQTDPRAAIEFARANLQTGDAINSAVQGIVSAWGGSDPQAAADWIAQFPAGETRAASLNSLLFSWSNSDLAAAQNWISTQLTGDERNQAILQLATLKAQSDLPAAADLIAQIPSGQAQTDLGTGIVRRWSEEDFNAANDWVNHLPSGQFQQLSLAVLETVRSGPEDGPGW